MNFTENQLIDWRVLSETDRLPDGTYDLKLSNSDGHYFTEIRAAVAGTYVRQLDAIMSKNFDQTVYVTAAKILPQPERRAVRGDLIISAADFAELLRMAEHSIEASRSWSGNALGDSERVLLDTIKRNVEQNGKVQ